jgi:hypothetical protein
VQSKLATKDLTDGNVAVAAYFPQTKRSRLLTGSESDGRAFSSVVISSKNKQQPIISCKNKQLAKQDTEKQRSTQQQSTFHIQNYFTAPPHAPTRTAVGMHQEWVQCNQCNQWRRIPGHAVESLPEFWTCGMNRWDNSYADCSVPEEQEEQGVQPRIQKAQPGLYHEATATGAAVRVAVAIQVAAAPPHAAIGTCTRLVVRYTGSDGRECVKQGLIGNIDGV